MSRCKCPKSDTKTTEHHSPYFEDITTKMEERRCDLLGRHKYLKDKITTMERSIPALMAYNMWMSKKCENAPYCKIREIMKKFAPYPDQTEKLLENLKNTVKNLNKETDELHEKIIQADVKLEETEMELESLELMNKELNDTVNKLEKEIRSYTTPSLHSIHSEDLLCLSKIRQLAKEELNLKNCIKELEQKETIFKEHMDRLLTSKEYQNICDRRKIISCIQDKKSYMRKKYACSNQNDYESKMKKKQRQKQTGHDDVLISTSGQNIKQDQGTNPKLSEKKVKERSSWMSNWWAGNQKSETEQILQMKSANPTTLNKMENPTSEKSKDDKSSTFKSKSAQCHRPCFTSQDFEYILKKVCMPKFIPPCITSLKKPFCEQPRYKMEEHGIRTGCKPHMLSYDLKGPCEICPLLPCNIRPIGNCRCNCKGKCANGLSDTLCNCSNEPLDPSEEYQPTIKQLADLPKVEDSEDSEYCECCLCGCEDNDEYLCECE
ncbi:hypothetical protein HZU73_09523 [Apis mellifera caucasica]|uniref:Uncharacterized protein LOC551946 isoform X1 n=1 Tax=Apis mellifera TaxID=7460 RepID=A0A7M7LMK7_APIME|nr:uncharacterized protein LOC551946 isoform X1 [Apis mellifera]KAG6795073.1 hypothetical protein HZU73_09523 [Apis mellifera caucasica]KAG9428204.1 hypothetical protein HZU67_09606 [Apis mellifera carnica]|eukprot:XP_006561093.1 uncharacterized protein LOC551946 isoform X1 [Apis mellifera]